MRTASLYTTLVKAFWATVCFWDTTQATHPKSMVTLWGTGTWLETFPKPTQVPQISPCPRAQGTHAGPAEAGIEHSPSSRGHRGGCGERQQRSQRPGTGTPPMSCQSLWSAQSASQRAAVTVTSGREGHLQGDAVNWFPPRAGEIFILIIILLSFPPKPCVLWASINF